jgi:hypothetical protein
LPPADQDPFGHARQRSSDAAAGTSEYLPGWQEMQRALSVVSLYFPAEHSMHSGSSKPKPGRHEQAPVELLAGTDVALGVQLEHGVGPVSFL